MIQIFNGVVEGPSYGDTTPELHGGRRKRHTGGTKSASGSNDVLETLRREIGDNGDCIGKCPRISQRLESILAAHTTGVCNTVACALKSAKGARAIPGELKNEAKKLSESLKSAGPLGVEWLSDTDISDVLRSAANCPALDGKFDYFPIDMRNCATFSYSNPEKPANFTIVDKLVQARVFQPGKCYGIVLNTDNYPGGGQHWVCIFADFRTPGKATIEYFNSAKERFAEFDELCARWKEAWKQLSGEDAAIIDVVYKKRIQNDGTECGVYSTVYILSRAFNIATAEDFNGDVPYSFAQINAMRQIIFAQKT